MKVDHLTHIGYGARGSLLEFVVVRTDVIVCTGVVNKIRV